MERTILTVQLTKQLKNKIEEYVERRKAHEQEVNFTKSVFARSAMVEYMRNHPIK